MNTTCNHLSEDTAYWGCLDQIDQRYLGEIESHKRLLTLGRV